MADAKKFSIYISPTENGVRSKTEITKVSDHLNVTTGPVSNVGWAIGGFAIVIRADPTISIEFQHRLGRMLGFLEEIEFGNTKSLGNYFDYPTFSFLPWQR